jgi:hypothetical protein
MEFDGEESQFEVSYRTKGMKLPEIIMRLVPQGARHFFSEELAKRTVIAGNKSSARAIADEELEAVHIDSDGCQCTVSLRR